MEHEATKRKVKVDPFVLNEQKGITSTNSVDKLKGYYDEARNRLKNYLGREEAMGSGSSTPRKQEDGVGGGGGGGNGTGEVMFQHRPPHIRLEGKQEVTGEEFTDISYSDLGFIIQPQQAKTLNNNYRRNGENEKADTCRECPPSRSNRFSMGLDMEGECDIVSTAVVDNGNSTFPSNINIKGSNSSVKSQSSSTNINFRNGNNISRSNTGSLKHRGSDGSFTMSHVLAGRGSRMSDNNLDDLRLEEITT